MRKIDEKEFRDYTIAASGWSCTICGFGKAKQEFENLRVPATLYGNRFNGTKAIIDTKQ